MEYKIVNNDNFQLPIIEVENLVTNNKYRSKVEERLKLIGQSFFPNYNNHGVKHALNTALFALIITNYINIPEKDINLLIDASLLHDIGRVNDYDDIEHGKNGAQIAYTLKKNDRDYTGENLRLLLALIEGHTHETYDNQIIEKYKIENTLRYKNLLQIIKDADIIDRVRLSANSLIELERLNFEISKKLFLYAKKENEKKQIRMNPQLKINMIARINEFINLYRNEFDKEEFLEMKKNLILLSRTDIYSKQALKEYENSFLKYYAKIWKKSLSDFDTYKGTEDFKFLVTCPTLKAERFQKKPILSCSLITNQHIGTFNKIPIGIVLEIEEDSILGISSKDMHSLVVRQNEIVHSYSYLNSTTETKIYTKTDIMSLKTPKEIEIESIQENIKQNGNILILGEHSVYSDILLNGEKVKLKGIVILEPCEQAWLEEAEKLADKLNLQIKKINYQYYYSKIGINSAKTNLGGGYSIYDLCFLESILKGTSNINESEDFLVQQVGKNFYIRSYEENDYCIYSPNEQKIDVIIKNDDSLITITFDGNRISYYFEQKEINKESMNAILLEAKFEKKQNSKTSKSKF